jgi:hypothetical protein
MREIRQSGSEGGAARAVPTPIRLQMDILLILRCVGVKNCKTMSSPVIFRLEKGAGYLG